MAIKQPVMSTEEAFEISCKKNGMELFKRKKPRKYILLKSHGKGRYIIFCKENRKIKAKKVSPLVWFILCMLEKAEVLYEKVRRKIYKD